MSRLALTALVLAALLSGAPPRAAAQQKPADTDRIAALHREAVTLYRSGQFDQAATRYQELLTLQPENKELFRDLMWLWWRAGKSEQTAKVAEQVTGRWPDNLEAWNLLGSALAQLERKSEAVAAFEKSLKLDPGQLRVWRVVAQLQLDLEQYKQAEHTVEQAFKRHPDAKELYPLLARAQTMQNDARAASQSWAKTRQAFPEQLAYHYQEASALAQSGQTEAAVRALDELVAAHRAAMADPEQLKVWRLVGQLYLDLEQPAQAERVATEVLRQQPNAEELPPILARAQTMLQKHGEAARSWSKARHSFPEQLSYHYQEVSALAQSGQTDAAIRTLDELVAAHQAGMADPEQLKVWRLVTQHYIDHEYNAKAEAVATQVLQHHPDAKEFFPLLARAQSAQKKYAEAAQNWSKARRAFPDQLGYHYQEVSALAQIGKDDAVVRSLDEMVKDHYRSIADPEALKVWRLVGQLYTDLRQYEKAERLAEQVLKRHPNAGEFYPVLARAQTMQGKFAEAAVNWRKARQAFPEEPKYQYQEAVTLQQSGKVEEAMESLRDLSAKHPDFQPAVNMLVDQAIVQEDWRVAADLLESRLADPTPADSVRFLKLAGIYQHLGDTDRFLQALDRTLALNPNQGEALMMKAEHYQANDQAGTAVRFYRQILAKNPWSLPALDGLASAELALGNHDEALSAIRKARQLDPTDPYLLITEARLTNARGDYRGARRMLTDWMAANDRQVVPVLLYHGLLESPDDPWLASPVNMTVAQFEDQIRGLRDAGYTAITAAELSAWYEGRGALPSRPVLITFDDARRDSLEHGDAVLAKYKFKATMFVPITNVERNLPGYASWDLIKKFQRTGRWEFQSHGSRAAEYITIDPEGRRGLFLVNRQWLPDENRMESEDEWRRRIAADYEESYRKISQQLGVAPVAFAFPNSQFGQVGFPNVQEAVLKNLAEVKQVYGSAYHQETYGINVRSDDPIMLERMEPRQDWSGHQLVSHFQARNPYSMMIITLLRHAAWQGRTREAHEWLTALEQDGIPQAIVLMEQARIHFTAGDPAQGRILVDRALQLDPVSEELAATAASLREGDSRWSWSPAVSVHSDSNDRSSFTIDQQLGSFTTGQTQWQVLHRSGFYTQDAGDEEDAAAGADVESADIMGHGGGLGLTRNFGLFHTFRANGMAHVFSGGDADGMMPSAGASLRSRWTDSFSTDLGVIYEPIETAEALEADVQEGAVSLQGNWRSDRPWDALAYGRGATLSDDNTRVTASFELGRRLVEFLPRARLSYRFTFDDTANISPNYYSPQQLMLHQVGLGYDLVQSRIVDLTVRYLPGFGTEQRPVAGTEDLGSESRFSQGFELEGALKWNGRPWLQPTVFLSDTPTYNSQRVGLRLNFRF